MQATPPLLSASLKTPLTHDRPHASDQALHARAVEVSTRYKKAEAELLDVLDQVDRRKIFLKWGTSSLYAYCVEVLKLSESVTYNLIAVMRKSREVPELREKSMQGAITLSNARRVAAVITPENKSEWLERATTLCARQLEREISKVLPGAKTQERATYVTPTRVKLELGLSESEMLKLRRAQDQVSQARGRSVTLEETLAELMNFYLARKCPLEKARRHVVKQGTVRNREPAVCDAQERPPTGSPTPPAAQDSGPQRLASQMLEKNSPARAGESCRRPARVESRSQSARVQSRSQSARVQSRMGRSPIPAHILHAVHFRDERKCQYRLNAESPIALDPEGLIEKSEKICGETRFLEIHHIRPVAEGGTNTYENLITLCAAHHSGHHAGHHASEHVSQRFENHANSSRASSSSPS